MLPLVLLALAADPAADQFETHVRPLLAARCYACHADRSGKKKGGLALDSRAAVLAGGDSGPAVVPGDPDRSLLLKAVGRHGAEVSAMPPTGDPLSPAEVSHLRNWVQAGAPFPGPAATGPDPTAHWAFRPVTPHAPPPVKDAGWPRTGPDRFLLAKLEAAGLAPAADAAPETVARRLATVLTGLPPAAAELDRFLAAWASDPDRAVGDYADELLASVAFGERWARHWQDVVRYADTAGNEYDYRLPGAWRYRDYLVRAFNSGLSFDRFVREHLAGDLLPPRVVAGRNEALLATAWWNLGEAATAPVDLPNDEAARTDDRLDVLGKAFTGLTVGCARCHDHKFDPLPAKDYYALSGVAVAAPARRAWANEPALDAVAARLRDLRHRHDRHRPVPPPVAVPELKHPGTVLADFAAGVPAGWLVSGHAEAVDGTSAPVRGLAPGLWSGTLSRTLPAAVRSPQFVVAHDQIDLLVRGEDCTVQVIVANHQAVRDPIYDVLRQRPNDRWEWVRVPVGRWRGRRAHVEVFTGKVDGQHQIFDTADTPKARFGLRAVAVGDGPLPPVPGMPTFDPVPAVPGAADIERDIPAPERFLAVSEVVGRDVPVNSRGDASKPKGEPVPRRSPGVWADPHGPYRSGSGRLELANAVASPNNPLTARVWVNRVWHHAFGRGLVPTVDNLGRLGEPPSHPELLNHLAHRFVSRHNWSTKSLLRELVTSRAFRTASGPAPVADPGNALLSHYPLRRLDAEAVRDAVLCAAGTLDRTVGGPPVPVPHRLAGTGSDSGNNTPPSGPADGDRRRSLYLGVWRNIPDRFLEVFDKPPPAAPFGRREVSGGPAQALALLNDPFVAGQVRAWADRVAGGPGTVDDKLAGMVRAAFARRPRPSELARLRSLVDAGPGGWADVAAVLVNSKEFTHVP